MRVLLLSPRVPPGLLTAEAWDVLRGARAVLAADPADPQVVALVQSGVRVASAPTLPAFAEGLVWIPSPGDTSWSQVVAERLVRSGGDGPEVVVGSYDAPGARVLDLVEVMDQLRSQCPWTQQQTHESLGRYLLEETYETLETIEDGDTEHLREELGDLLMQVVFHARIAAERDDGWDLDDVAEGIVEKLVSRNPHVFGDVEVSSADEVDANWQAIKARQKRRTRPDEGVPRALPALAYADAILDRLGPVDVEGDDLGARLLRLVQEARAEGADAESVLRARVRALLAE